MNKKVNKDFKKLLQINADDLNPHVKLIKVVWKDANTNSDSLWLRDVIKQKLLKAETIGYLLHEDKERIVVCGFLVRDEQSDILDERGESVFRNVHVIPKSQIDNILVLKIDLERSKEYRK